MTKPRAGASRSKAVAQRRALFIFDRSTQVSFLFHSAARVWSMRPETKQVSDRADNGSDNGAKSSSDNTKPPISLPIGQGQAHRHIISHETKTRYELAASKTLASQTESLEAAAGL